MAPPIPTSLRFSRVSDLTVDEATHLGVYCLTYRFFISLFLMPIWDQLEDQNSSFGKLSTLPFFVLAAGISALEGVVQSFFELLASVHPLLHTGTFPTDFFTGPKACFRVVVKCLRSS